MDFLRVVCFAFAGFLLAIQLKSIGSNLWIYASISVSLLVIIYSVDRLAFVMRYLEEIMDRIGLEQEYYKVLFKIIGVSYLCEVTSNVCKESGFLSIASQIEIGGKLTIIVMAIPIMLAIMEMITGVF